MVIHMMEPRAYTSLHHCTFAIKYALGTVFNAETQSVVPVRLTQVVHVVPDTIADIVNVSQDFKHPIRFLTLRTLFRNNLSL